MGDADRGRRHAEPARDQSLERSIGTASLRDRTHARLQHAFAAMILDPDDLIAGGLWGEPHGKDHTVTASS